jgi:hypothetical protein|tara:strand:+ start:194 stop:1342 length:1149 start_codon:yes stop_codon:yes gene_type:complete
MKKYLVIFILSLFFNFSSQADHQYEEYSFHAFHKYETKGSDNYYQFNSDLIQDDDVKKEIDNNKKTGLISYLLFENDQIKIDEQDIPIKIQNWGSLLPSHSVGKSLVSYVTGYAICEGYIDNINVTLDNWSTVKGTLYEGQKLIDLLNMQAGDQKIIGEKKFNSDNKIKNTKFNVNVYPLQHVMNKEILQNTKKSKAVYNYNALATNTIMNYTIYKVGDDYQKLLNKIFQEDAKIKDSVYFSKTLRRKSFANEDKGEFGRYSFYATRYDYLRIAKSIMDHWNNDTCVGKYLKTIYEQRINKNKKSYNGDRNGQFSVSQYTKKYGGQFHFDIIGLAKKKILGMDGFGGQQVIVDFDSGRIIVVHSLDRHYNWKKIVHKKLKQK